MVVALPDALTPSTAILPVQHRMMRYSLQRDVLLELPEHGIDELADEEGDHYIPF